MTTTNDNSPTSAADSKSEALSPSEMLKRCRAHFAAQGRDIDAITPAQAGALANPRTMRDLRRKADAARSAVLRRV